MHNKRSAYHNWLNSLKASVADNTITRIIKAHWEIVGERLLRLIGTPIRISPTLSRIRAHVQVLVGVAARIPQRVGLVGGRRSFLLLLAGPTYLLGKQIPRGFRKRQNP